MDIPPKTQAYIHNINVETSEYLIKQVSKYFINVYARGEDKHKMIDSLHIDNPKLKDILGVYGVELIELRKMTFDDLIVWSNENKEVKRAYRFRNRGDIVKIDCYNVTFIKEGVKEEPLIYKDYDYHLHLKAIFYEMFNFLKTTTFNFTHRNYSKNKLLLELIPAIYYQMDYWKINSMENESYNKITHLLNRDISIIRKILTLDTYTKNNKHTKLAYYLTFDKDSRKHINGGLDGNNTFI